MIDSSHLWEPGGRFPASHSLILSGLVGWFSPLESHELFIAKKAKLHVLLMKNSSPHPPSLPTPSSQCQVFLHWGMGKTSARPPDTAPTIQASRMQTAPLSHLWCPRASTLLTQVVLEQLLLHHYPPVCGLGLHICPGKLAKSQLIMISAFLMSPHPQPTPWTFSLQL